VLRRGRRARGSGSSSAPYINSLANGCGLATNYKAVSHPSLPNYIAATSGDSWGIADDNPPSSHPLAVNSYAVRHNPEAYYTNIRTTCNSDNVPMGTTTSGAFVNALTSGTLPKFSFVTPNLPNDMHDCSIATGDAWLQNWVPKITASPSYQAGSTVLIITWDEDDGHSGNQVATIVVSPCTTPGATSGTAFTHYSLLRTTEELLGISTFLGNAASATSMRSAFGL
jgi:phosphatidylinositol-3-phosphatase